MSDASVPWLSRSASPSVNDDVGAVLRAWRLQNGRTQTEVAALLGTTQQHLSQVEKGIRPLSLEQRRVIVAELGIPPEDLGLSSGQARQLVSRDDANPEIAASRFAWRTQRRWLNAHRSELARRAVELHPAEQRVPGVPLITTPDWMPSKPIELSLISLRLDESPQRTAIDGSEPESASTRPLRVAGARFDNYTAAVKCLDPPQLFESRPSYRLLGGSIADRQLDFGLAAYFDKLDISEAVGHELAMLCMDDPGLLRPGQSHAECLPFRSLIADPFDPRQRAIIPAITTLTIRLHRYPAEPSFLLHWRDPTKVATAGGVYDVIPAGEFQPSGVALWDRRNDFDLWRNIVREYSEELLGTPEHDGTRSQSIEYSSWPLHQLLADGLANGSVTAHLLGIGLDALTLAATILTVVVLDDDAFNEAFGAVVRFNDEGEIVSTGESAAEGVPFTGESVRRMLTSEPMASPGAACLALAWKHREALLGL